MNLRRAIVNAQDAASRGEKTDAPKQELDHDALRELVEREVPRQTMGAWVHDALMPAMGEKRIEKENGKTTAYSLDNIVKEMTRKVRDAEGFNYGLGNARSKGATKFKSLRQIQEARDRVVSDADFEAARKESESAMPACKTKSASAPRAKKKPSASSASTGPKSATFASA